jgi:DNA-binding transcriptional LysR family regulator
VDLDLELTWLKSWLAVVDAGGFARASDRIYLSQPRVSAHVANLERVLGCTLIDRKARPLTLTEEGRRFLPRARAILASIDDAVSELRSTDDTVVGRVTLASFASASSEFVPGVIAAMRETHPEIQMAVLDLDVDVIDATLIERRASVALRPYRPEPTDRTLIRRGLWREPLVVLVPEGHELLRSTEIELGKITEYPLITIGDPFAGQSLGYEAWTGMHHRHLEPNFGMVSHQPTTLAAMVRAGYGVGLLNLLAARMVRTEGLEVRPLANPAVFRDVGIWWHEREPLSRAAQAFIDFAIAAERPEGTDPPESE